MHAPADPHDGFVTLVDEVARLRGRLRELFAPVYAAADLTDVEMAVLNAVVGAATPPTVPRIGRSLGHPRQVVQRAAQALAGRGLIAFAPNPDHKRALLLLPAEAGIILKAEADRAGREAAAPVVAALDPPELHRAAELLRRVRSAVENAGRNAP